MKNVSVPIDFRPQSEAASQHALVMARHSQSQVVLLNLLKAMDAQEAVTKQMEERITKHLFTAAAISTEVRVDLVKDIGNIALDFETNWVNVGSLKLAYAGAIIEYASTTPTNL